MGRAGCAGQGALRKENSKGYFNRRGGAVRAAREIEPSMPLN